MTPLNDIPVDTELREIQDFISRLETGGFDYDTLREGTVSKIRVDELMQLIKARDAARGKEAAQRLQSRIARYGDGQIVYFNSEAVVPVSAVLAELSAPTDQKEEAE